MSKELTPIEELVETYQERRFQIVNNPHIKPFVRTAKLKELDLCIKTAIELLTKDKEQREQLIKKAVIDSFRHGKINGIAGTNKSPEKYYEANKHNFNK